MMLESSPLREVETIGRYRVLRTLDGSGRHGIVLAEAPDSRRRVALRVAREEETREAVLDAFLREREIVDSLDHPGVVGVTEVGEDPVLGPYLAMEFVDGLSLRESLRRGALGPDAALSVLVDVANVLEAAHARGHAHGDLRPSRILLDHAGSVALAGFGAVSDETTISVGAGWPYLAPERIAGAPPSFEADRWAFAVVALELLTGQLPAEDGSLPADLDPAPRDVFQRALAREAHARHPSLRAFLEELLGSSPLADAERAALIARLPPSRRPVSTPEEISRRQRRVVAFAVFGIVGALLLRAGGDWMLGQVPVPPRLRMLEVSSAPPGATVLVDGVPVGETPRRVFAPGDAARIHLAKDGYQPVDQILDGSDRVIDLVLQPSAPVQMAAARRALRRNPAPGSNRAASAAAAVPEAVEGATEPESSGLLPLIADWLRDEGR